MKKLMSILAVSGLALASAAQAQAQAGPSVFRPAGNWTADFGDDYCRLSRSFTDGKDTVSLALERLKPGAQTGLILVGDGIKAFRGADQIGYTLLPGQAERSALPVRSRTADGKQYLNLGTVTLTPFTPPAPGTPPAPPPMYDRAAEQAAGKGITAIALTKGMTTPARIETGELGAPIQVLQECADDLVKSWGVDPKSTAAMPVGGGAGWLPQGTIPYYDFAKMAGGANQVRLMIDAAGKPTKCAIYQPTLGAALNDKICSLLMANGKFMPAKNAAGEAVAGYWIGNPQFLGPAFGGRRG